MYHEWLVIVIKCVRTLTILKIMHVEKLASVTENIELYVVHLCPPISENVNNTFLIARIN